MTRSLSALLASNSAKFGYSGAVVKSLKMELHAVAERIRYGIVLSKGFGGLSSNQDFNMKFSMRGNFQVGQVLFALFSLHIYTNGLKSVNTPGSLCLVQHRGKKADSGMSMSTLIGLSLQLRSKQINEIIVNKRFFISWWLALWKFSEKHKKTLLSHLSFIFHYFIFFEHVQLQHIKHTGIAKEFET